MLNHDTENINNPSGDVPTEYIPLGAVKFSETHSDISHQMAEWNATHINTVTVIKMLSILSVNIILSGL